MVRFSHSCVSALVVALTLATFAQGVQAQALVPSDPAAPLPAAAQQIIAAIPNEETPPTRRFYFRSNEWRQDVLAPHLAGRGGILVGVGSDQNYTMAAMAHAQLLLLCDFDHRIPIVHDIYRVLVPQSDSPRALIARFSDAQVRQTAALLEQGLAGNPDRDEAVHEFRTHHHDWHTYLKRDARWHDDAGHKFSWLGDPTLYDYVRKLFQGGRIISHVGDVTGTHTLQAIGHAAHQLGLPVRIVYFSNAEQFFHYTPQFIANMKGLPTDDHSIVVRTIRYARIKIAKRGRWHYMVQDFPDFLSRIQTGFYPNSYSLIDDLLAAGPPYLNNKKGISTMTAQTPRARAERRAHPVPHHHHHHGVASAPSAAGDAHAAVPHHHHHHHHHAAVAAPSAGAPTQP